MKDKINTKYNPNDIVYIIDPIERKILRGKVVEIQKRIRIYPQEDTVVYYGITTSEEDDWRYLSPENCVYSTEEDAIGDNPYLSNTNIDKAL